MHKLNESELRVCAGAVDMYKKYRETIHFGDMYRLSSPFDSNMATWQFVSQDRKQVLLFVFNTLSEVNGPFHKIKLEGLDFSATYVDKDNDIEMRGAALMQLGINVRNTKDFKTAFYYFEKR